MASRVQIEAAISEFARDGITFVAPWQGDLDDLERERFNVLCAAIDAVLRLPSFPEV
jgi:hypothetical protein